MCSRGNLPSEIAISVMAMVRDYQRVGGMDLVRFSPFADFRGIGYNRGILFRMLCGVPIGGRDG